jgi:hypothetical protein
MPEIEGFGKSAHHLFLNPTEDGFLTSGAESGWHGPEDAVT